MESSDRGSVPPTPSVFTPPMKTLGTPVQPSSTQRISTMRPLATAYKASSSDYQVGIKEGICEENVTTKSSR